MSAIISKELDKKLMEMSKKKEEDKTLDAENRAYIMSLFQEEEESKVELKKEQSTASSTTSILESPNKIRKVSLKSILKRAKNN